MRFTIPALVAAATTLLAAPAADAKLRVDGRGWGHGIGLSQYGAYGYALIEARGHAWILQHYYPGTSLAHSGTGHVRVLLRRASKPTLSGVGSLRAAGGRRVRLSEHHAYRVSAKGGSRLVIADRTTGKRRATVTAPATLSGGPAWRLRGRADNGVRSGTYRGTAQLVRSGRRILVVNRVGLESYLRGVVAAEMPASWPAEALESQAVVARSYALRERQPGAAYDMYADTRSQMYQGRAGETGATDAAVRATRKQVVASAGGIAQTFFFSSSGGRTASNEEVWGGTPISYLRSVADPHDDLSPYHRWTVTYSDREAAKRLASVSPGKLRSLHVVSHTPSGRAAVVAVRGKRGTAEVPAAQIESLLDLRSTWFAFKR
jgi:stage II sporulation protein D